jgi:hypothetical protein
MRIAKKMTNCLWQEGLQPVIAAPNCRGSIAVVQEELILREELACDALLAVNTDESYNRTKFMGEVGRVVGILPIVGLIEEPGTVLQLLETFSHKVKFRKSRYMNKCETVASSIRDLIRTTKAARQVPASQQIPRRRIT